MKCHNQLCIYQEDDQCMLEEIEIDQWGRCIAGIATVILDGSLKAGKKMFREHIENPAAVPYKIKKNSIE